VRAGKYIYAFLNAWQLIILAARQLSTLRWPLRKLAHINLQLSGDKECKECQDAGSMAGPAPDRTLLTMIRLSTHSSAWSAAFDF